MSVATAYVDTSCLLAIAFVEPSAPYVAGRLAAFDVLIASNLLEAELRSACVRDQGPVNPAWMRGLTWATPQQPLTAALVKVLAAGYLRGADLWHVAVALDAVGDLADATFLTLDLRQRAVAAARGFAT